MAVKDEKLIDELKYDIINAVDQGQKKVLKQILRPYKKRGSLMMTSSISGIYDKETQV